MRVYRQGDVVLRQVDSLPKDVKPVRRRLRVSGETGNLHVLEGEYKLYRCGRQLYVVVEEPCRLIHPEHQLILVSPGIYRVERVRSFELADAVARIIEEDDRESMDSIREVFD